VHKKNTVKIPKTIPNGPLCKRLGAECTNSTHLGTPSQKRRKKSCRTSAVQQSIAKSGDIALPEKAGPANEKLKPSAVVV
jgi:hypothetical protein